MKLRIPVIIVLIAVCMFAGGPETDDEPETRNFIKRIIHAPIQTAEAGTPPIKGGPMVRVPAGEFMMGSDTTSSNERPAHKVYLDEFYIDKYEVSNRQYSICMIRKKCEPYQSYKRFSAPNQPVIGVGWNDAVAYCKWAGKRLPTEAEWEKAARGTDGRTFPWGEGIDCTKANYQSCKNYKTKPVGSYPAGASPYGALDMSGNVLEWTADWYKKKYYATSPDQNPKGPETGMYRILRDGSWKDLPSAVSTTTRYYSSPEGRGDTIGFRCAR